MLVVVLGILDVFALDASGGHGVVVAVRWAGEEFRGDAVFAEDESGTVHKVDWGGLEYCQLA
jgi:hypothetical protein